MVVEWRRRQFVGRSESRAVEEPLGEPAAGSTVLVIVLVVTGILTALMHAEERGAEKQVDDAVQEIVAAEGNEAPQVVVPGIDGTSLRVADIENRPRSAVTIL